MLILLLILKCLGSIDVKMAKTNSDINQKFIDDKMQICLRNIDDSSCYVRLKIFSPTLVNIDVFGNNWTRSTDGYWYYNNIVEPGYESEILQLKLNIDSKLKETFNIVIIDEVTEVLYNEDGTEYADRSRILNTTTEIY